MTPSPAPLVMHVVPCPLCGSEGYDCVLQSPDWTESVAGEFQIVRCRSCGHMYMNPAPVDASIADCYPSDYGPHQVCLTESVPRQGQECSPSFSGEPSGSTPPRGPWYLSSFVRNIPGPRWFYHWVTDTKSVWIPSGEGGNRRALELGCSSGWFLEQLQQNGWSPTGVDLVEGPLAQVRAAGFDVHQGTLETVRFDDDTFDAVFAWMVLEHVPRPRETLRNIARVLRRGGHFAFSVPNLSCWEPRVFGSYWLGYELPRHLQHFTSRRLRRLLTEEGFEVQQMIHQPSFFNWLGSLSGRLHHRAPTSSLTRRIEAAYEHNPPLAWYFVLGPLARLNAFLRQSGRLTVVTRRL